MVEYLTGFLLSTFAATALTWIIRNLATGRGLLGNAESARLIGKRPIPRLGGVAVFGNFTLLLLGCTFLASRGLLPHAISSDLLRNDLLRNDLLRIVALGCAFFGVGLIDDLVGLRAWQKLAVQVAGAVGLFASGIRFNFCNTHIAGSFTWLLCLGLTVLWVVLICNAINLIDGLDGLAAGASLFSMVTIFALAMGSRADIALATVLLAGSMVGFLAFNFNPASIFLGDSGSMFVGFILSAFVMAVSRKQMTTLDDILVPTVSLALPLTDVGLSILRRFLSGRSLFGADHEHIYHKLLELGFTQRQVVLVLYAISAICAVLSLFLMKPYEVALVPVAATMLLLLFFGLRKLNYQEFGEIERAGKRLGKQRTVCARNIALRKAVCAIQNASDADAIVHLLQTSLHDDFDGFRISVVESFGRSREMPSPWQARSLAASWKQSHDRIVYTLDLVSEVGQEVGTLSLFQSGNCDPLVDYDLLKGDLRRAVVSALQRTIGIPHPECRPDLDAAGQPVLNHGLTRYIEREV